MMGKHLQNEVALQCYAVTSHMFATMCDPDMRGEKFNWNKFARAIENQCEFQCQLNMIIPKKHQKEAYAHARKTGGEIWERYLKESKFGEQP